MYRVRQAHIRKKIIKDLIEIALILAAMFIILGWAGHVQLQEFEDAKAIRELRP